MDTVEVNVSTQMDHKMDVMYIHTPIVVEGRVGDVAGRIRHSLNTLRSVELVDVKGVVHLYRCKKVYSFRVKAVDKDNK